jgi:hypothetical protein
MVPTAVPGLVRFSALDSTVGCDIPIAAPIAVIPTGVTFANPKSRILVCPRLVTKMFAGLRSHPAAAKLFEDTVMRYGQSYETACPLPGMVGHNCGEVKCCTKVPAVVTLEGKKLSGD